MRIVITAAWLIIALSTAGAAAQAQTLEVPAVPAAWQLKAASGVRTVAPAAPDWCGGEFEALEARDVRENKLRDLLNLRKIAEGKRSKFQPDRDLKDLTQMARLGCSAPDDANARSWLATYRQLLVNETSMPDAAISQLMGFALSTDERKAQLACAAYKHTRQDPAPERAERTAVASMVCRASGVQPDEIFYWLDRDAGADDELLRAAMVWSVAGWGGASMGGPVGTQGLEVDDLVGDTGQLAAWVLVRQDALHLDPAKFEAALGGSRLDETERVFARVRFWRAKRLAALHEAAWAEAAGRVPGLGPIVTTVPQAAFDAWATDAGLSRDALDRAFTFERDLATRGKGSVSGCVKPLREQLMAFLGGAAPASVEDVEALMGSPVGNVLAAALFRCELVNGHALHASALAEVLKHAEKHRGPRVAALHAARRAVALAARDDDRFPYRAANLFPFGNMRDGVDWLEGVQDHGAAAVEGVVAKVAKAGGDVTISFKKQTTQVPVYKCKETNRIHRIRPDGVIEYRKTCVKTGERTVVTTPAPVTLTASLATGVAKGHAVRMFSDSSGGQPGRGYPAEVYGDAGAERLVAFLGVPVGAR